MHVDLKKAPEVLALLKATGGHYAKDHAVLVPFAGPKKLDSNWDEGAKTWWTLVDLADNRILSLPESGNIGQAKAPVLETLPENTALVETSVFQGKPFPARIHMNPANMTKLLPEIPVELTGLERFVLDCIGALKSGYRAEEYRRKGLKDADVETIKASLLGKGLIDKRGSVTVAGRNARSK